MDKIWDRKSLIPNRIHTGS